MLAPSPAPAIDEKLLFPEASAVTRLTFSELQYGHVRFIRYTSKNEKGLPTSKPMLLNVLD
jgi:hypothetical protein